MRALIRKRLATRAASAELTVRRSHAGERIYARPGTFDQAPRRVPDVVRILSPFDNAVIQRQRSIAVFDFDYTIECYTPEAKRQFGYFALPLTFRDRFVGRMDCKAHRADARFEIKALFLDDDVPDPFLPAFATAVVDYAEFTGCGHVQVQNVSPRALAKPIKQLFA